MFLSALSAWNACAPLRAQRRRLKNFTFGRQWDDPVSMPDGSVVSMGEAARRNLCQPITNNLLRQIVKSVVGRYRAGEQERALAAPAGALAEANDANQLEELDARTLEEFVISGCAIQRVSLAGRPEGPGPWVDIVSPGRFFVNRFTDPRGHDIELLGMLHDWTPGKLMLELGRGSRAEQRRLRAVYADAATAPPSIAAAAPSADLCFTAPSAPGLCRVIEVWRRDGAAWTGAWHAPDGTLLRQRQGEGRQPFAVKFYPLIDGEVHSPIEDVVDRQIQVNRTLTMVDRVMAVSAKELLLMPDTSLIGGPDWTIDDYAARWAVPGSVIPYRSEGGRPEVVNTTGINAGLSSLLAIELQLMEQCSGVGSAMRGMTPQGASTATLYNAQAENSAIALTDIFAAFTAFRRGRDSLLEALAEASKKPKK